MGYTAQAAGLAVSPRGIGALTVMPIIGMLTGRIESRWMIGGRILCVRVTSLWMGRLTLQISQWSLFGRSSSVAWHRNDIRASFHSRDGHASKSTNRKRERSL